MEQGWYSSPGPECDVVLSTRVRLARNLMGYTFPPKFSSEKETEVRDKIIGAFRKAGHFQIVYLDQINPLERKVLLERNVISQEFSVSPNKAVVLNEEEGMSAMINEEDHLRMVCIKSGLALSEAYQKIDTLDSLLEESIHYAASLELGYLNTSMNDTGTGLRASVMLHLSGLVLNGDIGWALKKAGQFGLQIKGFWGEGENSLGNMYQIANQISLGAPEKEIVENIQKGACALIQSERIARTRLLDSNITEIEDSVYRALGILTHCRVISSKEAIELLAALRFGVSLQIIKGCNVQVLTGLMILSQKSQIQKILDTAGDETDNRLVDYTRAKMIRDALKG